MSARYIQLEPFADKRGNTIFPKAHLITGEQGDYLVAACGRRVLKDQTDRITTGLPKPEDVCGACATSPERGVV